MLACLRQVKLSTLKVDGGMTVNELLMQLQADAVQVPVVRPVDVESTALGAAYAAGLAVGVWKDVAELCAASHATAAATTTTPHSHVIRNRPKRCALRRLE